MKILSLFLLAVFASAQAGIVELEWEIFKVEFNKTYPTATEHLRRFNIFRDNLNYIKEHNRLYDAGKSTFTVEVNKFADLTNEEFVAQYNGYKSGKKISHRANLYQIDPLFALPDSVDWRKKGYVTPVKNQEQCGSCWAFSAVASMEGAHFKKAGKLVSLSEQNLVDCAKKSHGCGGGWMDYGFQYTIKNKGIDTEASYAYKAVDEPCTFKREDVGATLSSYKDLKSGSEKDLVAATAKEGPISVAIDAGHMSFQFYHSGVYDEPKCSPTFLDHGVTVVGYGSVDSKDYYIVKNSWGSDWGIKGYIWMSRNKDNQCGIASQASFPIA